MKKIYIIIGLIILTKVSIGQTTITTQAELNALASTTILYGDLIITTVSAQDSSTMVTDLSPLLSLDTIYGDLKFKHTAITDFSGLANISFVKEVWVYENTLVKDLSTMDGPIHMNRVRVYNNPNLEVLSDFSFSHGLYSIFVYKNHRLKSVDFSFHNLESSEFSTSVSAFENPKLKSFKLKDENQQVGAILLDSNIVLENIFLGMSSDSLIIMKVSKCSLVKKISGFQSVKHIGICNVQNNPTLNELCFVKQTMQRQGISTLSVGANAPGANSEAEIMATDCSGFNTGINELNYKKLSLYPNPAHNEVFVEIPNKRTPYQIYDISGKIVQQGNVETNGRIGLNTVSGGMYILLVGEKRSKLVIQ